MTHDHLRGREANFADSVTTNQLIRSSGGNLVAAIFLFAAES